MTADTATRLCTEWAAAAAAAAAATPDHANRQRDLDLARKIAYAFDGGAAREGRNRLMTWVPWMKSNQSKRRRHELAILDFFNDTSPHWYSQIQQQGPFVSDGRRWQITESDACAKHLIERLEDGTFSDRLGDAQRMAVNVLNNGEVAVRRGHIPLTYSQTEPQPPQAVLESEYSPCVDMNLRAHAAAWIAFGSATYI